jgi:photosystem II stability/assembly factor-like uncharacterized protein
MGSRIRIASACLLAALLTAVSARAAAPAWTPLGPFGGSVETLAVAPGDGRALYVTLGPQGAFRSGDGGLIWTAISTGTTTSNVAVDPTRPGTIYLATSPGGLRKSTDGGGHWTPLAIPVTRVQAVAVDPARPSRLYAGTSSQGVWRSTDGGSSWQPARVPLPVGRAGEVHALSVPRAGGIVYAGTGAGVFKSADGALTWQPTGHGPSGVVLALAAAPSDPKTVYASVAYGLQEIVFNSRDGGASWRATAGPPLPIPRGRVLSLAVSPSSPGVVWAGTDPNGLFKTTDGGAHWVSAGLPPQGRRVTAVAVAQSSPSTLYVGVTAQGMDLGGVFASADGGASWIRRGQGLSGLDARALAAPPGTPGLLWAGLSGQGLFHSANGGRRWARVALPGGPSPPTNGIPLVDLEIAPSSSSTSYALALSWLWRSTDAGASWTEAFAPPAGPRLQFLRVDPADPFRLWGSGGTGPLGNPAAQLLRSNDGGETWENAPTPNLGCELFDLAFAPSSPSTLYVAGALSDTPTCKVTRATVFRSTDDGASWTAADAGLTAPSVTLLAVDPLDPRLVYAGTGGSFIYSGNGVWKSTDGGVTWARAGDELQGRTITAVAVSPLSVVWAATGGSVFRSGDGGATWSDRTDGLQAATIYKLLIDPADPRRVYAATSGGIWVLEDGEP